MVCLKIMQTKTSLYTEYITKKMYVYRIGHQRYVHVAIDKLLHM